MPSRWSSRRLATPLVGAVVAASIAACGGSERGAPAPAEPPRGAMMEPAEFPRPNGRSLAELRRGLGPGPVLAPSVSVLEPGRNRFGFALFDRANKQILEAPAALYVEGPAGGAMGPFPVRSESLAVDARFRSRSTASDPDAAASVYIAELRLPRAGRYDVLAVARLDDRLVASEPLAVKVVADARVPEVGEPAPRTATPTVASAGGAIESIETRVPPDSMHTEDFADVVGRRPAILLFATPALCQSRVCGPVVDIAEQVKADHRGDAAFIHMEVFEDNEIESGPRPQVVEWGLPSEPWLFAVDRRGRIAARLEGAFSARELEAALRAATSR